MASKPLQILLAVFLLLLTVTVASNTEDNVGKGMESKVATSPIKSFPLPKPQPAAPPPPVVGVAPPPSPVKLTPPPPPVYKPVFPPPPPIVAPAPPTTPPPIIAPAPPTPPPTRRPRNTKECFPLCLVRCKLHSRKNVCLRACVTCCDRCKCVPPGQYGNKEKCGKCYANMTTRGGRPKCP